jgi:hypothetical protein
MSETNVETKAALDEKVKLGFGREGRLLFFPQRIYAQISISGT